MARSVKFHGKIIVHPGAEIYVDLSGMVQPGVDDAKIAACIAEAPNGQPGVLHVFADSKSARDYFGAGSDAADAVKFLMEPSNDDRVVGGATLVFVYKPNNSSQSEFWLVQDPWVNDSVAPSPTVGFKKLIKVVTEAGAYNPANAIPNAYVGFAPLAPTAEPENYYKGLIVEIISGWGKGQQREVESSSVVGGKQRLLLRQDLDWDVVPFHAVNTPTLRIAVPQVKLTADEWGPRGLENEVDFGPASVQEAFEIASRYAKRVEVQPNPFGGLNKPTMFLKFDPTGGGNLSDWTTPANWLIPQAVDPPTGVLPVEGTCAAAGASGITLNGATNPLTPNFHFNRWLIVTGINPAKPAQANLLGKMYKIRANAAGTVTLYGSGLGGSGVPSAWFDGLRWKVVAFTDAYIQVLGEEGVAQELEAYVADNHLVTAGPPPTTTWTTKLMDLDLSLYPTLSNLIQKINDVPGMNAVLGDGVDSSLASPRFDFGRLSEHYGRQRVAELEVAAPPLPIGSTTLTIRSPVVGPSIGEGYEGAACFPSDMFPYWVILDEGGANEEYVQITGRTIGPPDTLACSPTTKTHVDGVVVAMAANGETGYRFGSQLVFGPGEDADGYIVRDNNQKAVEWVTQNVGRFNAERATNDVYSTWENQVGACHPENNSDIYKKFYHGEVGESVMSIPEESDPSYPLSWEEGLNALLRQEGIRTEAMAVSEDLPAWNAGDFDLYLIKYKQHLLDCEDSRSRRQGYVGVSKPLEAGTFQGTTYSRGCLEFIRLLNEERIAFAGQEIKRFASDDVEKWLKPWSLACMGAGLQLGMEPGEGLTLKYLTASDVRSPLNDWDPRDPLDARNAMLGGLFFLRPKKGRWRVGRGQTTHVSTDNLARTDINVWYIRNLVADKLQDELEERFGGAGIGTDAEGIRFPAPARISSVREQCATILEEQRADGWIVDSQDENKKQQHAWRGLGVRISGDICMIKVQVFPKTAINFVLIDVAFQLPRLSS